MESCSNQTSQPGKIRTNQEEIRVDMSPLDTSAIHRDIELANDLWYVNPDSSKQLFLETAKSSILSGYHEGTAKAYVNLSFRLKDEANHDSSLYYLRQALFHSLKMAPDKGMASVIYAAIGELYHKRSKMDTAALYMYKALTSLDQQKFRSHKNSAHVYHAVGAFWLNNNYMENALPYLQTAEMLALLDKDPVTALRMKSINATILCKQGLYDSAISSFKKVLKHPATDKQTLYYANYNLGTIYLQPEYRDKVHLAQPYLLKAAEISQSLKSKFEIVQANANLGNYYILMGEYKKAEPILLSVVLQADQVGYGSSLATIHANLGEMYDTLGMHGKAYSHSRAAWDLREKLLAQEKTETINKLEVRYRTAEKDKLLTVSKLKIAHQENLIQRQLLWIIAGTSIALLFISVLFFKMKIRKHKNQLDQLKATIEGEEKERTRLARDLHDGIVSRLSAIKMNFSALPLKYPVFDDAREDYQKIIAQLEQSIAELRTTSHNLLPDILHQAGLAEAVRIYSTKISQLSQLDIEFILIGDLPRLKQEFQLTVYRIIQELINNTIKHANATHSLIQFQVVEDQLNITVDDNGDGMPFNQLAAGQGIGLQNLRNRVNTLGGTLEIESNKGTSVYLTFHLSSYIEGITQDHSQAVQQ